MKSKLKQIFENVVKTLISKGYLGTAGFITTTAVTLADKRYTRVRWDGVDWEYKWSVGTNKPGGAEQAVDQAIRDYFSKVK